MEIIIYENLLLLLQHCKNVFFYQCKIQNPIYEKNYPLSLWIHKLSIISKYMKTFFLLIGYVINVYRGGLNIHVLPEQNE